MQNFSFLGLSSRLEPRSHKISLEPHTEATIKDPDPKKFRGPLLTSLICVPNFKVLSGREVPQLEKPNDPPKATFGHVCFMQRKLLRLKFPSVFTTDQIPI